jgi:uncharacterized protein
MKARVFAPHKLDVEAFAKDGASLQGEWPAQSLTRLADAAAPEAPAGGWPAIRWTLDGENRTEPRSSEPQIWLHLQAQAQVSLTCQRCLQPVQESLSLSRWFRFVRDEETAAMLDADSEDDVLVLTRNLNTQELIEDELLLSLPLVPRHETCPQPLAITTDELPDDGAEEEPRPNPFATLAALKERGPAQ